MPHQINNSPKVYYGYMDIQVDKDKLIAALQIITPITDKSSSKPILSNFVLDVPNAGAEVDAELSATDYEISIKVKVKVAAKAPGAVCISAKKMLETCREYRSQQIHIASDEKLWVHVVGDEVRLDLPSVEIGLYPQMELVELPNRFRIATSDLKRCIEMTIFACQANETRKNLMGVNLALEEGQIAKWTATDGHRLAQTTHKVGEASTTAAEDIIIPRKSLVEILKVLELAGSEVEVSFDARTLKLSAEGLLLVTRLIEGKFPNVDPVIPRDNDKELLVKRELLANSLKIISVMSNDKIKPVKLSFEPGLLRLESEPAEGGKVTDRIPVEYQGEPFQVGFNARYLLDVLGVLGSGENIKLVLKGALNPCLISIPEDTSFLSVVMPLRIEW